MMLRVSPLPAPLVLPRQDDLCYIMFRGSLPGAAAATGSGTAEDRLESLKRQYCPPQEDAEDDDDDDGGAPNNGLGMNLQDQYDQQEAEQQQQAAKRQRSMMPTGDFGGAGMVPGMMQGMPNGGANGTNAASAAAGGMGGNPMANGPAGAVGGGGLNMMNAGMAGMNNNLCPMNPQMMAQMRQNQMMMGGGMLNNGMAMNHPQMNMARAGMMSGLGGPPGAGAGLGQFPQGMPSALMDNDMATALYLNDFQDPRMMGLMGQRGGLGFAGGPFGGFGAGNPFGLGAQNPYTGLTGFPPGQAPGAAAMGLGARAPGAAPMPAGLGLPGSGLPGSNARRAQIMALMDMENELQQQQEAAKVTSAGMQGGGLSGMQGGAPPDSWQSQRPLMNAVPPGRRETPDTDGSAQDGGALPPTPLPEPPMDIPTFSTASTPSILPLPPVIEEGAAPHYSQRAHIPLGIDEDNNWLTEFQCFIRFDLIEVVQASRHVDQMQAAGGKNNNNNTGNGETFQQVGVRCRYCAHLHPGQRASRSSAFPSSIRQLYQSFTMMLRDHFEQCSEIPPLRKKLFAELKAKNSQGAYDSKQYWIYAAEKLGMLDSEHGIQMTADSQATARLKPPFGTVGSTPHTHSPPKLLVSPEDIRITSDFLYTLLSQVQIVHLIDSERVGKRKTLRVGLPGFGCRYCCHVGRCGLSRMFPLRRRMLPGKVSEIYEHVKRCTLFPTKEKELLSRLKGDDKTSPEQEKEFFDRIWERLGCESEVKK